MSRSTLALRTTAFALGCLAAITTSGCYTSVVKSGLPAAPATAENDEKWHSGLIYGLAELSGPYDLSRMCPNGWAEIKTETSFLNGLVQAVTWSLYNPQTVTVRCAAGGAPMAPAAPVAPGVGAAPQLAPAPGAPPPPAPPPASPPPAQ